MKILHTYCLNYNIGDYALGMGVRNLLRQFLKVDLIGSTNLQGRNFDQYYIDQVVNKKYDLLIIGGGGIIHGSHWPNGWFWLIEKQLIKTIKIPFIVFAAGNNYFESESLIKAKTINHLKETFKRAAYFSVRNDGSRERLLQQTGIQAPEMPDPGFYAGLNTHFYRYEKNPYVIIQLANDKSNFRFKNEALKLRFIEDMKIITKQLLKRFKVIFAPHVFEDIKLCQTIAENLSNCSIWDFGKYAFDHCDQAISYYKYAELVLSMRGHGQILPISFNVPTISLENHPKHSGLMKKLNLSEYNINILDSDFREKLITAVSKCQKNRLSLVKSYKIINSKLWQETTSAFNEIKNKIS